MIEPGQKLTMILWTDRHHGEALNRRRHGPGHENRNDRDVRRIPELRVSGPPFHAAEAGSDHLDQAGRPPQAQAFVPKRNMVGFARFSGKIAERMPWAMEQIPIPFMLRKKTVFPDG